MSSVPQLKGIGDQEVGVLRIRNENEPCPELYPQLAKLALRHSITFEGDAEITRAVAMTALFARQRLSVLFRGETGTGKTGLARLYADIATPGQPFVTADCSLGNNDLIEDSFFGHEKGAYTGADHVRVGLFEEAGKGTVFLDEIENLPIASQSKLLRVLQDKLFRRTGGKKDLPAVCLPIFATNISLKDMSAAGTFRRDLYYRVLPREILLPSWRARAEKNKVATIHHLAEKFSVQISEDAIERVLTLSFSGNVRELESLIQTAAAIARDRSPQSPTVSEDDVETAIAFSGTRSNWASVPQETFLDGDVRYSSIKDASGVVATMQVRLPPKHPLRYILQFLGGMIARSGKMIMSSDVAIADALHINRNTIRNNRAVLRREGVPDEQ